MIRIHVYLLLDPTPLETPEHAVDRILTGEGWMDGIKAWEHSDQGQPMIDNINLQPAGDPGDDWTAREPDPIPGAPVDPIDEAIRRISHPTGG